MGGVGNMPGPPKKPYLVAKAEGNPGKRKLKEGPKFQQGFGSPPRGVKGEARKLWKTLAPELEKKGLSAKVYRPALEGLCKMYQRAILADDIINDKGMTFETLKEAGVDKEGNPKFVVTYVGQRPEVSIAQKSWLAVKSFCAEFGLTPAANGKIVVPKTARESLRDLLNAPGKAS